jgi:hypothetical protein
VHEPLAMNMFQRTGDIINHLFQLYLSNGARLICQLPKFHTLHVLHDNVEGALVIVSLDHPHDGWVVYLFEFLHLLKN